ncbi:hypothetical protein GCM10009623_27630 [Nocardioides aestuarii]
METMSRRNALRLAGGAVGAGVVGTTTLAGGGALAETLAGSEARRRQRTGLKAVLRRGTPLIGMSTPNDLWAQKVEQVGPGLTARRIYADLARGPESQLRTIEQAHRDGMLPVVSYKVGGDIEGAARGDWNRVAQQAADRLAAFNKPTAVAFWHEPYTDMSPRQFVRANRQILPHFKQGRLRVGPILNGFLLDRQEDVMDQFATDRMLRLWDWFGIDTYQGGTADNPGPMAPGDRIKALRRYLRRRGHRHMPIGVGEYNGHSAETVASAGEALLSTHRVWFGCIWNSTDERDWRLDGARLRAFQRTLEDPRAM